MDTRIKSNGMVLVDEKTLEPIHKGQTVKNFRGEDVTVKGGEAGGGPSTGRIYTDKNHSYYPGVINAKWIEDKN